MSIQLPLDSMTVHEKTQLLEAIWYSLYGYPVDVGAAQSHAEILSERETQLAAAELTLSPWDDVKIRLSKLGQ